MNTIFNKLLYEMEKMHDTVLVTIISEAGSTPRGTGSQMLVNAEGRQIGTIGGGAVEKKAEELAMELLKEKRSHVQEFRLRSETPGDLDMACGGDVEVLFQYISAKSESWKELAGKLVDRVKELQGGWIVQRLDGGEPVLLDDGLRALAGVAPENAGEIVGKLSVLKDGWFSMPLPLGERAIIFGGGHCGLALAPILKSVGFRVVVFDDREEYANRERFPDAEQIICGDYTRLADYITFDPNDYVVVMTTGHRHDFEVEEQALRHPLAYIGVMGSAAKTASVNARLMDCGIPEEELKRVYTPIGLNIKGTTPAEIAISITAEMILVRSEHKGSQMTHCPA